MSHISKISIKNFRGIRELSHEFGSEKFVVLIGRGDSGKSTILAAINAALSPSWNLSFSDLDFYNQDTSSPIEIELTIKELPLELLRDSKFGFYIQNGLDENVKSGEEFIVLKLTVDQTLEPHWVVKARTESDNEDKPISASDRALFAVNFITDYTDNQFAYNRQSPLYALTKANIEDGHTIEHIKSELIRLMSNSIDRAKLSELNSPLDALKKTAEKLGLTVSDLYAQIDIKENPYTGNSIALHADQLPYRVNGKGSKRLMSIAIQTELTKQGGIVLIDELEQGLEPDRIVTLTRILKNISTGQVFITTHSMNVVLEAEYNNIFVVNHGKKTLYSVDEDLNACRRTNPQALFAKKLICCEGKTEVGFLRAIDEWLIEKYNANFSSKGVVIVNSNGGNQMYTYARKLHNLGYGTCIFADDDTHDLDMEKEQTRALGIKLFLCASGNCLEKQIIHDLPWRYISRIAQFPQKFFSHDNIKVPDDVIERISKANNATTQSSIREQLIDLSTKHNKGWFKNIPGGEFLGALFVDAFDEMDNESVLKQNLTSLLYWCDIK